MALTPLASVRYYEQVSSRDAGARDYFRMFMLPGVLHCTGGDLLIALASLTE